MICKNIIWFSTDVTLICDGNCKKAWGINTRTRNQLSKSNEDDFEWLSDKELRVAPIDPGTEEGVDKKPQRERDRLNRWCARECERSSMIENNTEFKLKSFNTRVKNIG